MNFVLCTQFNGISTEICMCNNFRIIEYIFMNPFFHVLVLQALGTQRI